LHWLAAKIVALAPAPLGGWVVGLFRFFYAAALLCGLTAFFGNPLFWLTWRAVMTAIMLCSIVAGVPARTALAFGLARLRNTMAQGR
jgi:hypothetical protein